MFVLKDAAKSLYIAMVHSDAAIDLHNRNVIEEDAMTRKLYAYAYSLPFWATMPAVTSNQTFADLIEFTEAMDMLVVPDSMFYKLENAYNWALGNARHGDPSCVRQK